MGQLITKMPISFQLPLLSTWIHSEGRVVKYLGETSLLCLMQKKKTNRSLLYMDTFSQEFYQVQEYLTHRNDDG